MKQHWNQENIPDQSGRVAIVTGSSSGIGYAAALALAAKNAQVIMAVRNPDKGNVAINKIKALYPHANIQQRPLDLADLASVRAFADTFKSDYRQLDLLINNAGVMIPPYSKTKDGFELQFGTNHLGHFALTAQLLDLVLNTPQSRIVNVSSSAHRAGNIDFDDLTWEKRKYVPWSAYGDSKIANLYFTFELAKKLREQGKDTITAACHPGWTATDLQRYSGVFNSLNHLFAQHPDMGCLPTLYAAIAPDVNSGDFIGPGGFMEMRGYPQKVKAKDLAYDKDIAAKLWTVSEALTEVKYEL